MAAGASRRDRSGPVRIGLSPREARAKQKLFRMAADALSSRRAAEPPSRLGWFVPGRVEVLGKHTDYAGGRSLVCAIERGFCFVGREAADSALTITRADTGAHARFPLDPDLGVMEGDWSSFPAVVARRLVRDFGIRTGVELAFASDLPVAAGLSSGSALTVGVFLALAQANRLSEHPVYRAHLADPINLAEYVGCLENGRPFGPFEGGGGVGTLGGCEDQAAILLSEPGRLKQFRFVPVRLERTVPFPERCRLVVASSGVVAEKTGQARESYNAAARATAMILERWRRATGGPEPSLGELLRIRREALPRLRELLRDDPILTVRLEQFAEESEQIVPGASEALGRGDLAGFGALVDRSQAGAERGLGNQISETRHLARSARALGAVAASAFGAGFGGSVWALVERDGAEDFLGRWRADYLAEFPARAPTAEFFITRPCSGAVRVSGV